MEFSVAEIIGLTQGVCRLRAAEPTVVTSIAWDSREVRENGLFVALSGQRVDGYDFVEAALEAGAKAVLINRPPNDSQRVCARKVGAALIEVTDPAAAIVALAAEWRNRLRARVIGITGSSGKTTTKNFTKAVLERRWRVHATAGNQNNELGVPKTILDADRDCQVLVVELGVDAPGDMAPLTALVRPDWGVIVSIGASHLETLGDERTVAWEKTGLWRALPADGRAFLNRSDPWAETCFRFGELGHKAFDIFGLASQSGRGLSMIGASRATGLTTTAKGPARDELFAKARRGALASNVTLDRWGRPSFELELSRGQTGVSYPVTLKLVGRHNVIDACAAAAVGAACGLEGDSIAEALSACESQPGRAQVIESAHGYGIINDSYNANPLSMRAALTAFDAITTKGARYAVLGDMGELGDAARTAHEAIGALVADLGLDGVVFVGELSRHAAERAKAGVGDAKQIWECDNAAEAADLIASILRPGDAVLVKGSHFMGLDAVVQDLV